MGTYTVAKLGTGKWQREDGKDFYGAGYAVVNEQGQITVKAITRTSANGKVFNGTQANIFPLKSTAILERNEKNK
jgi:hypothetical protein